MFTTQECILMNLLKCGSADLSLLEKINYDLDDILDFLTENNMLSLNNIFKEVFNKAISELTEVVEYESDEIKSDLEYLLSIVPSKKDSEEKINYFEKNLSKEDYELLQRYDAEWAEDIRDCLNCLINLNPENDIEYWCNCQDTGISFVHYGSIYRKFFQTEIEEIEHDMGFEFCG